MFGFGFLSIYIAKFKMRMVWKCH